MAQEHDGTADAYARPPATVSSLKSEDSTEQLICKTPQVKKQSVAKSVESDGSKKLVVFLGLGQVFLGALLVGAGAAAVVKGAALARAGAGLWAGCVAVVAGVVGVLAGINDCYGLNAGANGSPLLTAFLALSLLCLACGHSAAVLAATGLHRDAQRATHTHNTFQDEMQAWTPVLTNIALLIIASAHCLLSILSIYHLCRRVCPCFRARRHFDHNQFDHHLAPPAGKQSLQLVDEVTKAPVLDRRSQDLCQQLEGKLQAEAGKKKKEEPAEFGSANSKEKLVTRWLGHQAPPAACGPGPPPAPPAPGPGRARRPAKGVRKRKQPQMVLLPAHPAHPAHPASTLGRVGPCVMVSPRYATLPLPLPPAAYAHRAPPHAQPPHAPQHAPLYYPVHDPRVRRRRSPRELRGERRGRRRDGARERDSQLTRSLERIHRKRRAERERAADAELKRTYTGLDRAYAEQFIAVCDESRHAAEQHDSLGSTSATSDTSHTS